VHTQRIEYYWNRQKNRIKKMLGVKGDVLVSTLDLFMFFDFFADNVFLGLMDLIKI
jgi:hypothetical protein